MINTKHEFLTTAPIPRVIMTMAVPTIISMMATSAYNLADAWFVSQLNTQSTAAVGITFTVITVFLAIGFFFGHGSGNYMAIRLGANDEQEARTMATTGFIYTLATSIVLTLLGISLIQPLCLLLGSTPTVLPYAVQYLSYILYAAPFIVGSLMLNVQIRQQGNSAYAMVGILSGTVLNILLDPLLIFTFGMGIRGAGIATLISQAVSFCVLLLMTERGDNLPLRLQNFSFKRKYIHQILTGGTPSLTRQGLGAISTFILNASAAAYGDYALAAMTIVTRITFLVYSVVTGLGQGYQPLCGFCYGARQYGRVVQGYLFCVAVGTAFLTSVAVAGILFSSDIIAFFRSDSDVISVGSEVLRSQFLTYPLATVIMLSNMTMQVMNKPVRANLLAAARRGLFFIPFLLILPRVYGLHGLVISQPLADVCTFAVSLPVLLFTFRQFRNEETAHYSLSKISNKPLL